MNYHAHIVKPNQYTHSECFVEVATAVNEALNMLGAFDHKGTPIVFGAHLAKRLPDDAVIFNTEQVFSWDYRETLRKHRVWDYSQNNIDALDKYGISAELCPIGYMSSMSRIKEEVEQDIDVLMYGSRNDRRFKPYVELCNAGVNTHFAFDVYGKRRDALIARAKVVLNVHYYPEAIFEIFRCSHLMANRKCIVSETGKDKKLEHPYHGGIVMCDYEHLVKQCLRVLALEENVRSEIGQQGFEAFSKTSMVESLKGLI